MLSFHEGDILNNDSTIVIPVTEDGHITDEFEQAKERFPQLQRQLHSDYETAVESALLKIRNPMTVCDGRFVLFATKRRIQDPSDIDNIKHGLVALVHLISFSFSEPLRYGDKSTMHEMICIPKLDCGPGGLPYGDVRMAFEIYLTDMPIHFKIYGENIDPNQIWAPITEEDLPPLPGGE